MNWMSSFVEVVNWEEESQPRLKDFVVFPVFVLFFPTLRFFLDRFLYE
ncbi:hypothetical protein MIMGU_mgv1a0266592mg, partial [Erythranthe guttata]